MQKFNNIYNAIKNKAIKERVKKEDLQKLYSKFEDLQQLELDYISKKNDILNDIQKSDIYILNSSLYCHFLEELGDYTL